MDNLKKAYNLKDEDIPVIAAPGGVAKVYGNLVSVDWTLYDVHLRISELMFRTDPDTSRGSAQVGVIEERATISIPWGQAKILLSTLTKVIDAYENVNGELKPIVLPFVAAEAETSASASEA